MAMTVSQDRSPQAAVAGDGRALEALDQRRELLLFIREAGGCTTHQTAKVIGGGQRMGLRRSSQTTKHDPQRVAAVARTKKSPAGVPAGR